MTPVDRIPDDQRASIIQNGLSRPECELFFALFDAAVRWRHTIVSSNRSGEQTEAEDRARWAASGNHNAKLIAAVDAFRDHFGELVEISHRVDALRGPEAV